MNAKQWYQRSGGRRSEAGGFQIKMETPIYDTVEEDEYDALVAKRREEARGFIVDDDGLGYGDEGEEEDWSKSGASPSSDESESELERRTKKKKKAEKKEPQPKKASSSLLAAAAMMGKQRLSAMFTSSVFKKSSDDKAKGISCDSIVDDVIAEFAPDEADRERRRRTQGQLVANSSGSGLISTVKSETRTVPVGNSMSNGSDSISVSDRTQDFSAVEDYVLNHESVGGNDSNSEISLEPVKQSQDSPIRGDVVEEKLSAIAEVKEDPAVVKEVFSLNVKAPQAKDPALSATAGWQAVRTSGAAVEASNDTSCNENSDFELDADGSLLFYILDAHEELYGANMGNIYLFGKVKAGTAYHSLNSINCSKRFVVHIEM